MKIGLLMGFEDSFRQALAERLAGLAPDDFTVEWITTGGVRPEDLSPYDVILDRISPEVPYYRALLAHAALGGTRVVNDPAALRGGDGILQLAVARTLGIEVPRAVMLPQKEYAAGVGDAALGNLEYPLPWEAHVEQVGLPAWIGPQGALREGQRVDSLEEIWFRYDRSGGEPFVLREHFPGALVIRALVVGGGRVLLAAYDPEFHEYRVDPALLDAETETRLVEQASRLAAALGLEIAAVDFALADGRAVLIDGFNPCPDFEIGTLGPFLFERVVESVADRLIELAREGRAAAWAPAPATGKGLAAWLRVPAGGETAKPKKKTAPKKAAKKSARRKAAKASAKKTPAKKKAPARKKATAKKKAPARKSAKKVSRKAAKKAAPRKAAKKAAKKARGRAAGGNA